MHAILHRQGACEAQSLVQTHRKRQFPIMLGARTRDQAGVLEGMDRIPAVHALRFSLREEFGHDGPRSSQTKAIA